MLSGTAPAPVQLIAAGEQLQQFALAQIDKALAHLANASQDPDKAIHETRRCLKRVRAILRLVRKVIPKAIYQRDNLYLRNIGRSLSALRDQAAAIEALTSLQAKNGQQLSARSWKILHTEIATAAQATSDTRPKRIKVAAAKLTIMRQRMQHWDFGAVTEVTLRQGIKKTYKKGRRALSCAQANATPENLHEWRKQVNHLRHQLTILQTLAVAISPYKDAFKSLATILGNNNDLAMLRHQLAPYHHKIPTRSLLAFQRLLSTYQTELTAQALQSGNEIYTRKANATIKQLWP